MSEQVAEVLARLLLQAWEEAEGKPVNVSYVATFADMARALAPLIAERERAAAERARDEGIRQAVMWLRSGYEYGTGPDWRQHGAEWVEDRATEARVAALAPEPTDDVAGAQRGGEGA